MLTKLSRKLYLYAVAVLISSIILTMSIMNLFFIGSERREVRSHLKGELVFLRDVLVETYNKEPDKLQDKLDSIHKNLDWEISFWKDDKCLYHSGSIPKITVEVDDEDILVSRKDSLFLVPLDEYSKNNKNFIAVKFKDIRHRPPPYYSIFITGILILTFLSILLIPYTMYIIKPFKKLMVSINEVSLGNFSNTIDVHKKNDFYFIAQAFNNMTVKIQDMINQKQRLIADVSHELRSPLTKIRLSLELLLKEGKGKQKYIDRAIAEIESLDVLIDDILESSKVELSLSNIDFVSTNLAEFIDESVEKNILLFDKQKLKIKKHFPTDAIFVDLDKKSFGRAINNIFSNLIKYSPYDSDIDIILEKKDVNTILIIRDYGKGVKEEELDKIFEPFYRPDDSRARKTGGTGLGLSIVKKITEIHGGNVFAKLPQDKKEGLIIEFNLNLSTTNS